MSQSDYLKLMDALGRIERLEASTKIIEERLERLETRPRPGRPPKSPDAPQAD